MSVDLFPKVMRLNQTEFLGGAQAWMRTSSMPAYVIEKVDMERKFRHWGTASEFLFRLAQEGYTLAELGEILGIPYRTVQRYHALAVADYYRGLGVVDGVRRCGASTSHYRDGRIHLLSAPCGRRPGHPGMHRPLRGSR